MREDYIRHMTLAAARARGRDEALRHAVWSDLSRDCTNIVAFPINMVDPKSLLTTMVWGQSWAD
ncbi:hypothetical protein J6590_014071 [Homalodisca vitripennis]|nr:hypothetical protein J6590_014071 [Homalodisca vitripennis]